MKQVGYLKIRFLPIFLLCVVQFSASAREIWWANDAFLYDMNLSGTLSLGLPLWNYAPGRGPHIPFLLQHQIVVRAEGFAESRFVIPQLISYLTPVNDNEWLWYKPGGKTFKFNLDDDQTSARNGPYVLTHQQGGSFTITNRTDNAVYQYDNYQLVRFISQAGITLAAQVSGGLIVRIDQLAAGESRELVKATYDQGRLIAVRFDSKETFTFDYSGPTSEQLDQVKGANGETLYSFHYEKQLISSIENPEHQISTYAWKPFTQFRRGDQRVRGPVWLESSNDIHYTYDHQDLWIILSASTATGEHQGYMINRRTGLARPISAFGSSSSQ